MFNLLPYVQKKSMRREYLTRLCIVALSCSFGIFLIASIFLLPSYFLSNIKEQELADRLSHESSAVSSKNSVHPDTVIKNTKSDIGLLNNTTSVSLVGLIKKVMAKKTTGIKIQGLNVNQNGGIHQIGISGSALSRENLIAFKKSLEDEPLFRKVDLPVSSLAKSVNIDFVVTVTGNF